MPRNAKQLFYLKFKQEVFLYRQESGKKTLEQRLGDRAEARTTHTRGRERGEAGAESVVMETLSELFIIWSYRKLLKKGRQTRRDVDLHGSI